MTERRCEIGLAAKIFCVEGVSIYINTKRFKFKFAAILPRSGIF